MAAGREAAARFPGRVFCDTSFFYACADVHDAFHRPALALAGMAAQRGTQVWTTWDVVAESVTLLRYRHSWAAAVRFLDEVKPGLHVAEYGAGVRSEAEQVFRRHGREHRLSFCDAISFVVVPALLERIPCLAFDEDFRRLGLTVLAAFH
jgi:predicted nucleic acid-binding protein